jgi:hypothetical protein
MSDRDTVPYYKIARAFVDRQPFVLGGLRAERPVA